MFGKKNPILDVIKYEGPQDVFVWKHPCEDFNTKSQLIVHESQEAIFFRNGQALDTFPGGRYTLETQNIPILRNIVGLSMGGICPFHCEVYYINKAISMGIPWGTDSPIEMLDAEYRLPVKLTSYGDFSLRVKDGRKFLIKLVGTVKSYTQENIRAYFSEIMAAHIRDCIANVMEGKQIGALHVNTQLIYLSREIKTLLSDVFLAYGLELNHFAVSAVKVYGLEEIQEALKGVKIDTILETGKANIEKLKIDVDTRRIQEEGKAKNAVLLGQGLTEAQINQAKGITEVQRKAFSVAEILAGNPGPNTAAMGTLAGTPFYNPVVRIPQSPDGTASDIVKTAIHPFAAEIPGSTGTAADRKARLEDLKDWFENGLITEDEYREKRKEILNSL